METGAVEIKRNRSRSWSPNQIAAFALPGVDPVGVCWWSWLPPAGDDRNKSRKIDIIPYEKMAGLHG